MASTEKEERKAGEVQARAALVQGSPFKLRQQPCRSRLRQHFSIK